MRDHSQQATRTSSSMKSDHSAGGAKNNMPSSTGRIASAVRTRVSSTFSPTNAWRSRSDRVAHRFVLRELLAGAAEAPLAPAVGFERPLQRFGAEIRPQGVREVELRVGELPEQEVGDA